MKKCLLMPMVIVLSGVLFAQPVNDKCSGAVALTVFETEAEAQLVEGDTRNSTDGAADNIPVCSANFYRDDVWYYIQAPDDDLPAGYTIKVYYTATGTDIAGFGIAIYTSCDAAPTNVAIFCGNQPENDEALVCLSPGQTVYIRVWSADGTAANWQAGWGTFRIAAFKRVLESSGNVLWTEDFNNGMLGWTTFGTCGGNADSNANAIFRFYLNGVIDLGSFSNPGVGVKGTHCNGAVGVDSDFDDNMGNALNPDGTLNNAAFGTGRCPTGNGSQYFLVSPAIDHSEWGVAGITLAWRQGLREYQSEYFVGYRIYQNGGWGDWRNYEVNTDDEYPINSNHFSNVAKRVFLGGAQLGDSLQIRFLYDANYYYWGIDDIQLIEAPCVDLRSMSNWYAIAPAVNTPSSQVRPWWPLNDVYNSGACTQTNVNLNCTIMSSGGQVVYNENVAYGSIEADVLVENVNFPSPVMVPTSTVAPDMYTGTYLLTSDQSTAENDFNFADNSNTFTFSTTEDVFALETGFTRNVAVNNTIYDQGAPYSYTYGNYFFFPNGSDYKLRSVTWGVGFPADVAGIPINLILFKWIDANDNEIAESSEREIIGFATHVFDGTEPNNIILETPLESFTGGDLVLEDNASYLMMIEYNAVDQTLFYLLSSEDYDYGGVVLSSAQAGMPTYASVLGFSPDGNVQGIDYEVTLTSDPDRIHFGWDIVPLVRLNIDEIVSTNNLLPDNNIVKVFPNPASDIVQLDITFSEQMDNVELTVGDVTGKVLFYAAKQNLVNYKSTFDVSELASGSYSLNVRTEKGIRTISFVVQH